MWHAMLSLGLHIHLLWLQGPPNVLYLKEYSEIILTFMINMIRNGKKEDKKHFKFQTWHAIWSSELHIFLFWTSVSSRCLVFERIFSNHKDLHDKYDKEWEKWRSKRILNFKHDMLCKVQGSISTFFWL